MLFKIVEEVSEESRVTSKMPPLSICFTPATKKPINFVQAQDFANLCPPETQNFEECYMNIRFAHHGWMICKMAGLALLLRKLLPALSYSRVQIWLPNLLRPYLKTGARVTSIWWMELAWRTNRTMKWPSPCPLPLIISLSKVQLIYNFLTSMLAKEEKVLSLAKGTL